MGLARWGYRILYHVHVHEFKLMNWNKHVHTETVWISASTLGRVPGRGRQAWFLFYMSVSCSNMYWYVPFCPIPSVQVVRIPDVGMEDLRYMYFNIMTG